MVNSYKLVIICTYKQSTTDCQFTVCIINLTRIKQKAKKNFFPETEANFRTIEKATDLSLDSLQTGLKHLIKSNNYTER